MGPAVNGNLLVNETVYVLRKDYNGLLAFPMVFSFCGDSTGPRR